MKTAVEWLEQQLFNKRGKFNKSDIDQAKEIFEQQIILSHINGQSEFDKGAISENTKKLATEYYNQTFKQK
jgi:hypothetical protein